jgi:hypothetical protein
MKQVKEQCDHLLQHLSVKFSQEVEVKWYDHMNRIFSKLEDIEKRMIILAKADALAEGQTLDESKF